MFRVSLKDFTVYGKHGAYEAEHSYQQPFIVSITVELNNNQFGDNLSKTVNYADLQTVAYDVITNSPPIKLMETMIEYMFEKISQKYAVRRIAIKIEKPEAKLPHNGGVALVEGEWLNKQEN